MAGFMAIHVFLATLNQDVDGIGSRVFPTSALNETTSRKHPTVGDKPGHDDR
jgi:hypothetical protein